MWWKILIFLGMSSVIILAFATPSPIDPIYALGSADAYRIFYFHVPQSWVAALAFVISMIFSLWYLRTRRPINDIRASTACKLGLLFAVMATITGSVFARITWGEFWNWSEIREVSIFILLLIYGAYFALRSAVSDKETRATLSAVVSILFGVSALFLIFVLPRIYPVFSQHPTDSIIDSSGRITMGTTVMVIFVLSLASFTGLFLWIYNISVRAARAAEKRVMERQ
jgi:heme exporter protein C